LHLGRRLVAKMKLWARTHFVGLSADSVLRVPLPACVCREVLYENGADGKPVVTGLRIARAGKTHASSPQSSM
jgi:hypothetical protein